MAKKVKNAKKEEKPEKKVDEKSEKLRKKKLEIANKFKDEICKKYKDFVKAVVIFGSFTRGDFHEKSDIDLLVVIDDTIARFSPEMKENFDDNLHEIGKKISEDITVQPDSRV